MIAGYVFISRMFGAAEFRISPGNSWFSRLAPPGRGSGSSDDPPSSSNFNVFFSFSPFASSSEDTAEEILAQIGSGKVCVTGGNWELVSDSAKVKKKMCKMMDHHAESANLVDTVSGHRDQDASCGPSPAVDSPSGTVSTQEPLPMAFFWAVCYHFFLIRRCCNGFQVLRHPWIVDKAQLSDRALTRQDADTVKVAITVLCHVSR